MTGMAVADIRRQDKVRLRDWVWKESNARGTAKLVALCLAEHYNVELGKAWPSYDRIVECTGLSREAVSKALKALLASGEWSRRNTRHNGREYRPTWRPGDFPTTKRGSNAHALRGQGQPSVDPPAGRQSGNQKAGRSDDPTSHPSDIPTHAPSGDPTQSDRITRREKEVNNKKNRKKEQEHPGGSAPEIGSQAIRANVGAIVEGYVDAYKSSHNGADPFAWAGASSKKKFTHQVRLLLAGADAPDNAFDIVLSAARILATEPGARPEWITARARVVAERRTNHGRRTATEAPRIRRHARQHQPR